MKKILLGTTGLFGAALLAAAANAETPKVTLGGFSDFQAGYTSDDFDSAASGGVAGDKRGTGFRNDNEITIKVDGKTNSGLGYGAEIDLEADVTADANNQGLNASRTFTYLEGSFGRFEMGSNKSVAATQRVDASSIAVATGGINGSWTYFVNPSAGAPAPVVGSPVASTAVPFHTTSKLASEHGSYLGQGDETTYNATKISYYTPKFSGFQAGVSYTPQLDDRGQVMTRSDAASVSDVWDFALGYNYTFNGGYKLAVAGTYEIGSGEGAAGPSGFQQDISAWNIGASLGWQGWAIAGSYGNQDDTGFGAAAGDESDYWTAGLAYATGPIGLSATYIDSTYDVAGVGGENDFSNLVIGADYKLAPGFTPYAEVSFYEFDGAVAANDNDGTAVILGTQVAF